MDFVVIALLIVFPALGALFRRWSVLALPLVGWPLFYLGLGEAWWGDGLGDAWLYIAALLTLAGVVITGLAVTVSRRVNRSADDAMGFLFRRTEFDLEGQFFVG